MVNNTKGSMRVILLVILVLLVALILVFGRQKSEEINENEISSEQMAPGEEGNDMMTTLSDGQYCFVYTQAEADMLEGQTEANEEHIVLNVLGTEVTGTKTGTQNGPEMFDGYGGDLMGTLMDDGSMDLTYSYSVEGASQTEIEVYKFTDGVLSQIHYPLSEVDGVLTPDQSSDPTYTRTYTSEECVPITQ